MRSRTGRRRTLDFATSDNTPLPEIAAHVQDAFQRAGYGLPKQPARGTHARLVLQLPGSGEELEMDLLKEALEPRWVTVQITPAASVRVGGHHQEDLLR